MNSERGTRIESVIVTTVEWIHRRLNNNGMDSEMSKSIESAMVTRIDSNEVIQKRIQRGVRAQNQGGKREWMDQTKEVVHLMDLEGYDNGLSDINQNGFKRDYTQNGFSVGKIGFKEVYYKWNGLKELPVELAWWKL